MCKSKFIKIRIMVNTRQTCIHLWPNIPMPSKLKRDRITYQCKGSVCVGEAGHGVGIWLFSKICRQIPCSQANQSRQMHKNFLELISFIRVATVREKSWKNENFSKSGKSQGTLSSGVMHQGWQWAFKGEIKPLWTFSTWWSFPFWK